MTSRRAVSGESSGSPGPFFRGENCSARGTSISDTARVRGKVSKMNSSSLMPCSGGGTQAVYWRCGSGFRRAHSIQGQFYCAYGGPEVYGSFTHGEYW
jgi:hypothetical protein